MKECKEKDSRTERISQELKGHADTQTFLHTPPKCNQRSQFHSQSEERKPRQGRQVNEKAKGRGESRGNGTRGWEGKRTRMTKKNITCLLIRSRGRFMQPRLRPMKSGSSIPQNAMLVAAVVLAPFDHRPCRSLAFLLP